MNSRPAWTTSLKNMKEEKEEGRGGEGKEGYWKHTRIVNRKEEKNSTSKK